MSTAEGGTSRPRSAATGASPQSKIVRLGRRVAPAVFTGAFLAAAFATVFSGSAHTTTAASRFSHRYPPDPKNVERPKITGAMARVPRGDIFRRPVSVSLRVLASSLPPHVLTHIRGTTWGLHAPVEVTGGASLRDAGPARIEIFPGAFLVAGSAGTIDLRNIAIAGVDARARTLTDATPDRGFIAAVDGGTLLLENDRLSDLGHPGVEAYGISLRAPGRGSAIEHCTIERNYIGLYLSHADGVRMLANRVLNSVIYGIDPHTDSWHLLIQANLVRSSGVHGIILAAAVHDSQVIGNTVDGAGDHGIVLFQSSNRNTVRDNVVRNTFDGIVVTGSSSNSITWNSVSSVQRFGLRISGASAHNALEDNTITGARLGAYVYGGASQNVLANNAFSADREDVRVRRDAPRNSVTPVPPASEIGT